MTSSRQTHRRRAGFTLIELLVSVVIIGILASFAMLGISNTKGKAAIASMKSDLRNLAQMEEGYFAANSTYSNDMAALLAPQSPSVTITIVTADSTGWSAKATHPGARGWTCALYYGTAAVVPPAVTEGSVRCQ